MAIGVGRMLGFKLTKNFNHPQFAISIGDFWRRWHISLSTWLKDYVYFPLGGSRVVKWRMYYNLFITFFLSGIWHGANWTFIMYGFMHGSYIVYESSTREFRKKLYDKIGLRKIPWLYTFLMIVITFSVVCFSRIFFRANNISDAFLIINRLFMLDAAQLSWTMFGTNYFNLIIAIIAIIVMETLHIIQVNQQSMYQFICKQPTPVRWAMYIIISIVIINFGIYSGEEFIYFQF